MAVEGVSRLDLHWSAELLAASRDVESMQAEDRLSVLVGLGHNVYRSGCGVDHRRRNDADLGPCSHAGTALHGHGNGSRSRWQQADLPERVRVRAGVAFGIEGVN